MKAFWTRKTRSKARGARLPQWSVAASLAFVLLAGRFDAKAHFPILIHDADLAATNGAVTVVYAAGHPFELEMEPVNRPARMWWNDPKGQTADVTAKLEQTLFRADTNGVAWRFAFEPPRGDSLVALDSSLEVSQEDGTAYREFVKVYVHRNRQGGWKQRSGQPLEILPLTRPYGLRAGAVFSGQLVRGEAGVADQEVYLERLNDRRPTARELPPEALITFAVRTDREGRFTITLPDPGWWILGAYVEDAGSVNHEGRSYRLEGFAGLWVRVESK